MASANQIESWVKKALDEKEVKYRVNDNGSIGVRYSLDGKIKSCETILSFRDDVLSANTYIEITADEDCRPALAEYLLRANRGLAFGSFELDYSDGEIRVHRALDCEDRTSLSASLVIQQISGNLRMFERYGDGLLAVMYGFSTPAKAIEAAEAE
jgi:hypothetical protein